MEPNKFATILHKKTNRITLVLVYTVLEWALIFLLLLNSFFFYLIIKFARYFGLKPPCLVCSRLDHVLEKQSSESSYRDLLCENHAIELSKSGYCFSHRKLVEFQNLCEDCLESDGDCKGIGVKFRCSCCGVAIDGKSSSSGVLEDTQKGNLISRDGNVDLDEKLRKVDDSDGVLFCLFKEDEGDLVMEGEGDHLFKERKLPQHLEFYIDHDDHRLIPVGLLNLEVGKSSGENEVFEKSSDDELVFEPDLGVTSSCLVGEEDLLKSSCLSLVESDEVHEEIQMEVSNENKIDDLAIQQSQMEGDEIKDENLPVIEDQAEETIGEANFEVADVEVTAIDDFAREDREVNSNIPIADCRDLCHKETFSMSCKDKEGRTLGVTSEALTNSCLPENGVYESKETEEELQNHTSITVEISEHELKNNVVLSNEPKEIDEDRIPDTPTSIVSLRNLHGKVVLLGRRVSANEEMLDEDGDLTNEELKSELRSEQKALRALYGELEEERNAATIATNHTMAMINRLQEEKAAIEMEALQYQRMMEEQAEYDQEALQLMNELLVKREREKQELEEELQVYRKKVMEYEESERIRLLNQKKDAGRNSSASSSNGLSVDLNNVSREEYNPCQMVENGHHDIPADQTLTLQDSLCCFEEERLSILEQLKALEEKLGNLAEEEDQHIRNMKPFEQFCLDNTENFNLNGDDANGMKNGSFFKDENQLLSLYDAAALESPSELFDGVDRLDPLLLEEVPITRFELEKRRLSIEEEVEHVYERLQALEADKEFIKHCISSLRKGDRGIDLLQEILQHLRDLKNIECRTRNIDGLC